MYAPPPLYASFIIPLANEHPFGHYAHDEQRDWLYAGHVRR